ncbi:fasciclin domain-containing protein [Sphingomicrobium aestuariivivum]|uniref:fasciclin domain-containing protein n=1 Tax=Sphingomicrobium aestuariivivum TaxID=1582356 RepID=UPI001FD6598C|nr:fasciclin domain-containing protein [Sphingomicrobium aestuariivivum]MCJ8191087.1 fasciclin domain-containing protein [Sphingomicrobium aestuariivivum]
MQKLTLAILASSALGLSACGDADTTVEPEDDMAMTADDGMDGDMADAGTPDTVVAAAQANPDFSTLVDAITTAELGETLSAEGPFTVFAPTNAAFEKVDAETLQGLMTEEQRETLQKILTYHVVAGKVGSSDLVQQITDAGGSLELTTASGGTLTATAEGESVVLTDGEGNKATVTSTDVEAGNGVIHVIDTVLMPAS